MAKNRGPVRSSDSDDDVYTPPPTQAEVRAAHIADLYSGALKSKKAFAARIQDACYPGRSYRETIRVAGELLNVCAAEYTRDGQPVQLEYEWIYGQPLDWPIEDEALENNMAHALRQGIISI